MVPPTPDGQATSFAPSTPPIASDQRSLFQVYGAMAGGSLPTPRPAFNTPGPAVTGEGLLLKLFDCNESSA